MSQEVAKCIIAPSMLAADLSNFEKECKRVMEAGCDWIHMDVMDGKYFDHPSHFVPNITWGPTLLESCNETVPNIWMDCHMMVSDPAKWVPIVAKSGGKSYTFHYEAVNSAEASIDLINLIHSHNMLVGIGLSPDTPASVVTDEMGNSCDMLLVMTVHPGWGGQKFMPEVLDKVTELRKRFPTKNIQVDGGVGPGNACQCAKAGSNVMVAGTAILKAKDPKVTIEEMRTVVNNELFPLSA